MLQRAVNFCLGEVTVQVESAFPERVLNLCSAHGIPFWDLTWRSPVCFSITMTRGSWRRLRQKAEQGKAKTPLPLWHGTRLSTFRLLRQRQLTTKRM